MNATAKQAFIQRKARENRSDPNGSDIRCPFCGGQLREGKATVPFVFQNSVIVVKGVPAEICANCHEPLMTGAVTDELTALLRQLRAAGSEVSVVSYQRQLQPVLVLAEEREKYGEE